MGRSQSARARQTLLQRERRKGMTAEQRALEAARAKQYKAAAELRMTPQQRAKRCAKLRGYYARLSPERRNAFNAAAIQWYRDHPDIKKLVQARSSSKHRANQTRYARERRRNNLHVRILGILRVRISRAVKRNSKSRSSASLLGCSIQNLIIMLESMFEPGMTWENYGSAWHIDHIIPCAIFDLSKPAHQQRCFHFSNLQPLWAADNYAKGAKVEPDVKARTLSTL